jgi:hypothetical protein
MAQINKPKTFTPGQTVSASDHNSNFDTAYAEINGKLDNANFANNAALAESKITFSGSGHDHSGGANGKNVDISSFTIASQNPGDILYYTGTAWARIGTGSAGQHLTMASGVPTWA